MRNLHEWFERSAAQRPDAVAVRCGQRELTYRELNHRANQLASRLRREGIGPESLVGLWVDRTLETVIGILGILKAGGAYLPLDVKYPKERTQYILEDAGVEVVLTTEGADLGALSRQRLVLRLDRDWEQLAGEPSDDLPPTASEANIAYVIYTSGSTGKPKGVVIEHRQVMRLFTQTARWYHFGEGDVWTMSHSHSFDVSVFEIFGALLHGGRLIVVPYAVSRSFDEFHRLLIDERVTVLSQTPTAFRRLLDADARSPRSRELQLRCTIFAGERLDFAMLRPWFERHGDRTMLVNMYGITETTVHSTFREVRREDLDKPSLIGIPIPDLEILLLDEHRRPVPDGTIGEIYVGGAGLAREYFRRPELTRERFIPSPAGAGRLYKSGDLARRLPDGELEYIGRADLQIQLRGFRVELGEIEANLLRLPAIRAAAVVVRGADGPDPKLVAFVVRSGALPLDARELRRSLRSALPDYMVPNRIVEVDALPLTAVGKLDRRALEAAANGGGKTDEGLQAEAVDLEKELVRIASAELETELRAEDDVFDHGATSLTITAIVERARSELGVDIPVQLWLEKVSAREVCLALRAEAPGPEAGEPEPQPSASAIASREECEGDVAILRELFAAELETDAVADDADVFDMGASSLTVAAVSAAFRERTGRELGVDVLLARPTLRELAEYLRERVGREEAPGRVPAGGEGPRPTAAVPLAALGRQLSALRSKPFSGKLRHLYASGGGKYAVEVYVEVRPGGVDGVKPGIYYHQPDAHALVPVGMGAVLDSAAHHPDDRARHQHAPFCLHLIGQLAALQDTYQQFSENLAQLDSGYVEQLVRRTGREAGLHYRAARALDFERVRAPFQLGESHVHLVALIAGPEADAQAGTPIDPATRYAHFSRAPRFMTRADLDALYRSIQYQAPQAQGARRQEGGPEQPHRRPPTACVGALALPAVELPDDAYQRRFSHRSYDARTFDAGALRRLLAATTAGEDGEPFGPGGGLELLVHVRSGRVSGLGAGLHRYDPASGELRFSGELDPRALKRCHTPFNRTHYEAAAFSLLFVADVAARERSVGPQAFTQLLRAAGCAGQRAMEAQAAEGLGLVPIGGMNVEAIRVQLGLGSGGVLLHGMVGGRVERVARVEHAASAAAPVQVTAPCAATPVQRVTAVAREVPRPTPTASSEIAIVGLSGRYPDARTPAELWANLERGRCSIRPAAEVRPSVAGEGQTRYGAFLEGVDEFDAGFFDYAPAEAETLDPETRLMLEVTWEALEDAGCSPRALHRAERSVGVFVGCMYDHYHLVAADPELRAQMSLQSYSGIVNRISHRFDFDGPSVAVDAACASSALAIHLAAESLRSGDCDVAIAGGVNLTVHGAKYEGLQAVGLLSSHADRAAFSDGDGFVPGEGAGVVVLKRLSDAERDGDRVHAVLAGSATNHSGRTRVFNMPSAEAQRRVIERALRRAQITPDQLGWIESAATGSRLGDPVELAAWTAALGRVRAAACPIGSIKGNVGHLEAASGISQLTKVIEQLRHQRLAPTVGVEPPSPTLSFTGTPLRLQREAAEWCAPTGSGPAQPRVAAIGSFGAGGSNVCLVVREHVAPSRPMPARRRTVLVLSARTEEQLREQARRLASWLEEHPSVALSDVAYTLARREAQPERLAVVVADTAGAAAQLREHLEGARPQAVHTGRAERQNRLASLLAEDAATASLLGAWIGSESLEKLAIAWTHGVDVAWTDVPGVKGGSVVTVPCYPFARTRHWVSTEVEAPQAHAPTSPATPGKSIGPRPAGSLLAEILRVPVEALNEDAVLADLGFNSLLAMRLVRQFEKRHAVTLDVRSLVGHRTVGALEQALTAASTDPRVAPGAANGAGAHAGASLEGLLLAVSRGELSPEQALGAIE